MGELLRRARQRRKVAHILPARIHARRKRDTCSLAVNGLDIAGYARVDGAPPRVMRDDPAADAAESVMASQQDARRACRNIAA
jgi:hypothetical protein